MKDNTVEKEQETTLDAETEAEMEDAALEVAASPLDAAGEPTTPILDFDVIETEAPNYEWIDVPLNGKPYAVKVRKGDVIDFMGSLDDADLLAMEEIFDDDNDDLIDDTAKMPLTEQLRINEINRTYQNFVLKNFILSPAITDENIDSLPKKLRRGMMDAYNKVNGIAETKAAVDNLKKK